MKVTLCHISDHCDSEVRCKFSYCPWFSNQGILLSVFKNTDCFCIRQ